METRKKLEGLTKKQARIFLAKDALRRLHQGQYGIDTNLYYDRDFRTVCALGGLWFCAVPSKERMNVGDGASSSHIEILEKYFSSKQMDKINVAFEKDWRLNYDLGRSAAQKAARSLRGLSKTARFKAIMKSIIEHGKFVV